MKLSESIRKALIQQINVEFHSAWLYRSISQDMKHRNLPGYAKWLDKQYEEERQHGFKIINYIEDRDGVVDFLPIGGIDKHYDDPLEVARESLAHEEWVSGLIRDLFQQARKEGDIETELFLRWFIDEQVEEEVNGRENVAAFEKAGLHPVIAHPKYTKPLKGKKSDPADAKWIAKSYAGGHVVPSFIPPKKFRLIRETLI